MEDPEERKAHKDLHYKIKQATELCRKILAGAGPLTDKDGNRLEPSQVLAEISMITGYEFDLNTDIIRQLNILIDMTDSMNSAEEGRYLGNIGHITFEGDRMMFPRECFDTSFMVPFETGHVYIPAGYETMLKQNYGPKFFVPKIHSPHEYPYYKTHQRVMRELIAKHPGAVSDEWIAKYL